MKIAVCDDNQIFLRQFAKELKSLPDVTSLQLFSNVQAFMMSVEEGKDYDVILMDIDLQTDRNGMEIAEELYKAAPRSKVIYITGFNDRFSQHILLHKANLLGYVTKPIDMEILRQYLDKIGNSRFSEVEPHLILKQHGRPISVPYREIIYLESHDHKVLVHSTSETIEVYEKLSDITLRLSDDFFSCHKSYLVHFAFVRRIGEKEILLKTGESIPVSRQKMKELREGYLRYAGRLYS